MLILFTLNRLKGFRGAELTEFVFTHLNRLGNGEGAQLRKDYPRYCPGASPWYSSEAGKFHATLLALLLFRGKKTRKRKQKNAHTLYIRTTSSTTTTTNKVSHVKKKTRTLRRVHSVIYCLIYTNGNRIFSQKYVSNVQNSSFFFLGRSNLTISTVFQAFIHYFRFWWPYWIFEENGHFMDILTSTSYYIYIPY